MPGGCRGLSKVRQERGDQPLRGQDVDVEHPLPVRGLGILDVIRAARTAGDVNERVHRSGLGEPHGERVHVLLRG